MFTHDLDREKEKSFRELDFDTYRITINEEWETNTSMIHKKYQIKTEKWNSWYFTPNDIFPFLLNLNTELNNSIYSIESHKGFWSFSFNADYSLENVFNILKSFKEFVNSNKTIKEYSYPGDEHIDEIFFNDYSILNCWEIMDGSNKPFPRKEEIFLRLLPNITQFGRYKGMKINEVPEDYVNILLRSPKYKELLCTSTFATFITSYLLHLKKTNKLLSIELESIVKQFLRSKSYPLKRYYPVGPCIHK